MNFLQSSASGGPKGGTSGADASRSRSHGLELRRHPFELELDRLVRRTANGKHVARGGVERKSVVNMLTALGRPDLIEAACGPPGPGQDPVMAFLREVFATRTRGAREAFFAGHDVCAAPALDLHAAFHNDPAAARGMLHRDDAGNLHIGLPIRFAEEPGRLGPDLPGLGENTDEILAA